MDSRPLMRWYDRRADERRLPWRRRPQHRHAPDPYRVWISEIMLQQTSATTARERFPKFLRRFPNLAALAEAPKSDVLDEWAGLGYYARAVALSKAARIVTRDLKGRLPDTEHELRRLPGIGPYAAAAIAAIAFGRKAVAVDGNAERVASRLAAMSETFPSADARRKVVNVLGGLMPPSRPGDFAQAVMDLGATICRPRRPKCEECPLRRACRARALGTPENFPRRRPKPPKGRKRVVVWCLEKPPAMILIRRRPEGGLLGGMNEFPTGEWRDDSTPKDTNPPFNDEGVKWHPLREEVEHPFDRFILSARIMRARAPSDFTPPDSSYRWTRRSALERRGLPSLMRKIARRIAQHDAGATTKNVNRN